MTVTAVVESFAPDLLLVDGRHMLWRAADKFDELSVNMPGDVVVHTGAVYGFLTILCKAHSTFGGSVIICWDDWTHGPAKRKAMYAGYKLRKGADVLEDDGQKQVMLSSMMEQQHILMSMLEKFGIPQAHSEGWEADDVMGTLAFTLGKAPRKIGIFTGDRDLYQCVTAKRRVIRPMKGGEYHVVDPLSVQEEYGVEPARFAELKALAGDPGDCIPGIQGIGAVTAAKILRAFQTAEEAVAAAEASVDLSTYGITARIAAMLAGGRSNVEVSKALATINVSVPLCIREGKKDAHTVTQELMRLQFRSILTGGRRERLLEMGLPMGV